MKNYHGLNNFLDRLDPGVLVCGQLHPEYQLPCYRELGHSTLGTSGRERAHAAHPRTGDWIRDYRWTYLADHQWRLDQRRRGRHPAGGDEQR